MNTLNMIRKQIRKANALHDAQINITKYRGISCAPCHEVRDTHGQYSYRGHSYIKWSLGGSAPFLFLNNSDWIHHPMSEQTKKEEPQKKSFLSKIKDNFDDKEEKLNALSTMVRLGILIWSGTILTLAYIKLPPALGVPEQKLDATFIASVFTGTLATFGVQAAKKNGGGAAGGGMTKEQVEKLIEMASQTAPAQTVRIEAPTFKLVPSDTETSS